MDNGGNTHIDMVEFSSFREFTSFALNQPGLVCPEDERSSRRDHSRNQKWSGAKSYEEAHQWAVGGWPKSHKIMEHIHDKILGALSSQIIRPIAQVNVCGEEIHMGNYIAGRPDYMIEYVSDPRDIVTGKIINIEINTGYSSDTKSKVIENYGVATCALIDALTVRGYSVEVSLLHTVRRRRFGIGREYLEITCPLKKSNQPLDIDRIAFALCCPAFLRRLIFSVQECYDFGCWDTNYGMCCNIQREQKYATDFRFDHAVNSYEYGSVESSIETMLGKLKQSGLVRLKQD